MQMYTRIYLILFVVVGPYILVKSFWSLTSEIV